MKTPEITIRPYDSDDYEGVRRNLIEGGLFDPKRDREDRLDAVTDRRPHAVLVAELGNKALGANNVVGNVYLGDLLPLLSALTVAEDFRHQRIGTQLVEAASDYLAADGHTYAELLIGAQDAELKDFYEKLGFSASDTCLIMERALIGGRAVEVKRSPKVTPALSKAAFTAIHAMQSDPDVEGTVIFPSLVYSRLRSNEARLSGNESAREDHAKYVDRPVVADGIPAPSSTVKDLQKNHWYRLHLDPEDPYEILFKPWHAPKMTNNTLFAPGLKLNSQGYYIVRDKNRDAVATLTLGRSYRWQEYTPSFQEHVLKDLISDAQELTRQAPPRVTRRINQN